MADREVAATSFFFDPLFLPCSHGRAIPDIFSPSAGPSKCRSSLQNLSFFLSYILGLSKWQNIFLVAVGFWLLASGFWLLASGFWLLAFGFCLLPFYLQPSTHYLHLSPISYLLSPITHHPSPITYLPSPITYLHYNHFFTLK